MGADVAVLIPWQDTGARARHYALGATLGYWVAHHPWPAQICKLGAGLPWCKASALASAMVHPAEVVIVADADCLVDPQAVTECVQVVRDGAPWAIPHWNVCRLDKASTEGFYDTGCIVGATYEVPPYGGVATGGVTIIRSDIALSVPMDGTFKGWGGEDYCWGRALDTLVGHPYRPDVHYDLLHLWHPPPQRAQHGPTAVNLCSDEDRRHLYFVAWAEHDTATMRALVEGGRVWPESNSSS